MKKRWFSLLLALLMVFSVMPLSAFALSSTDTVTLTIRETNGKTRVNVGDTLTYMVTMGEVTNLAALEFSLDVPSQLQVDSVKLSLPTTVQQSWTVDDLHLAAYGMNYSGNSTILLTVTCKAVSAGSVKLGVKNDLFVCYDDFSDADTQKLLRATVNSTAVAVSSIVSNVPATDNDKDDTTAGSSSDDKLSSSEVKEKFEDSKKDTVTFDVSDNSKISRTLFTLLSENKGKTAVLKGDSYTWAFRGYDICGKLSSSYFDSKVTSSTPKKNAIKKLTGSATVQNIHLAHEGALPGAGTLTISVDKALQGKTLYCYYYNETTGALELVAADLKAKSGKVSIVVDRGQDYILTDTLISQEINGEKANPETGAGIAF